MITVGSIVIRVTDLEAQKRFWMQALDYVDRPGDDDDFALLKPRAGNRPNVSLDAHPSERALPPRIHLDLYADDQAAEVARLETLGAHRVEWSKRPSDADYVIMEDPRARGSAWCSSRRSSSAEGAYRDLNTRRVVSTRREAPTQPPSARGCSGCGS